MLNTIGTTGLKQDILEAVGTTGLKQDILETIGATGYIRNNRKIY